MDHVSKRIVDELVKVASKYRDETDAEREERVTKSSRKLGRAAGALAGMGAGGYLGLKSKHPAGIPLGMILGGATGRALGGRIGQYSAEARLGAKELSTERRKKKRGFFG
jgi:phage tail tape-measure protein